MAKCKATHTNSLYYCRHRNDNTSECTSQVPCVLKEIVEKVIYVDADAPKVSITDIDKSCEPCIHYPICWWPDKFDYHHFRPMCKWFEERKV